METQSAEDSQGTQQHKSAIRKEMRRHVDDATFAEGSQPTHASQPADASQPTNASQLTDASQPTVVSQPTNATTGTSNSSENGTGNMTESEVIPEEKKDVSMAKIRAGVAFLVALLVLYFVYRGAIADRKRFAESSRELLPSKSVVVVTGWILKTAISISMLSVFLGRGTQRKKEGTGDANSSTDPHGNAIASGLEDMAVHFCTFLLLLCTSVGLSQLIKKSALFYPDTKQLYILGLALIPAWSWKDFISHLISVATRHRLAEDESLKRAPPLFNMFLAAVVIFSSASIQINIEIYTKHNHDEQSYAFIVANTLRQCMGLGAGFAVNNVFKTLFKQHWTKLWFQSFYCTIQFATIPLCQQKINDELEHSHGFGAKLLKFCVVAGNFVIGWAVKGFMDALFHGLEDEAQIIVTITVSAACIAAVTASTHLECKTKTALIRTVAAMNIGWTWTDWISSVESSDPKTPVWRIWLDVLIVSVVMLGVAALIEKGINWFYPQPPEESKEAAGEASQTPNQPEQSLRAAGEASQEPNRPEQSPAQPEASEQAQSEPAAEEGTDQASPPKESEQASSSQEEAKQA